PIGKSEAMAGSPAGRPTKSHNIALGIERMGLISLRFPMLSALVLVLLYVGAAFGVTRLKVDDSLSQLFRSDTEEFRQFEEVTRRFPSTEFDVLGVIGGKNLLARESLERIRELAPDLQLVEHTKGLVSLFSARQAPENGQLPKPLFPQDLPSGPEYDALIK